MNVVNIRKVLCNTVVVALVGSFCSGAIAQQSVPTPAPSGTQGPVPLPPGTPGPVPAKGPFPGMPAATGSPPAMPLAKGGGPTPLIAQTQDSKLPGAPRMISKTDPLPTKLTDLIIRDDELGSGSGVLPGQAVNVQYTGWLYDASKPDGKGAKFDSSREKQIPYGFIIGAGRVIKGWDQGVVGMKQKGKRTLIVPPQLAYGDRAKGDKIPANSTLLFEVELFDVLTPPAPAAPTPAATAGQTPLPVPSAMQTPLPTPAPAVPKQ